LRGSRGIAERDDGAGSTPDTSRMVPEIESGCCAIRAPDEHQMSPMTGRRVRSLVNDCLLTGMYEAAAAPHSRQGSTNKFLKTC
jgi:hypothetical protein